MHSRYNIVVHWTVNIYIYILYTYYYGEGKKRFPITTAIKTQRRYFKSIFVPSLEWPSIVFRKEQFPAYDRFFQSPIDRGRINEKVELYVNNFFSKLGWMFLSDGSQRSTSIDLCRILCESIRESIRYSIENRPVNAEALDSREIKRRAFSIVDSRDYSPSERKRNKSTPH